MTRSPTTPEYSGSHAHRTLRPTRVPTASDVSRFLRQLRSPHRVSALRAAGDGAFVSWTLKRRGVRPLLRVAGSSSTISDAARAREVAVAVDAGLGMIPIAPTCLRRSLTLLRELDRLGLEATLVIGVRNGSRKFSAHAWVQVRDVVVNDDPAVIDTYEVLAEGDLGVVLSSLT